MTHETPETDSSPIQRLLAYGVLILVGLSLAAFAAILTGSAVGAGDHDGFSRGAWPVVFWFPLVALPLGFVLMMVLLVIGLRRRSRENRGGAR